MSDAGGKPTWANIAPTEDIDTTTVGKLVRELPDQAAFVLRATGGCLNRHRLKRQLDQYDRHQHHQTSVSVPHPRISFEPRRASEGASEAGAGKACVTNS